MITAFRTACANVATGMAKNRPQIPHNPPQSNTATTMATGWRSTTSDSSRGARNATSAVAPRRLRVLVVEDEAAQRDLIADALGRAGHDVRRAGSVDGALEAIDDAARSDLLDSLLS